jgi:hypothetical protein
MVMIKDLGETIEGMISKDYKERMKAEYQQTKLRYEKLKNLNNKIEAAQMLNASEPPHDCPAVLLHEQQHVMGNYLHILEVRAAIEGIEL